MFLLTPFRCCYRIKFVCVHRHNLGGGGHSGVNCPLSVSLPNNCLVSQECVHVACEWANCVCVCVWCCVGVCVCVCVVWFLGVCDGVVCVCVCVFSADSTEWSPFFELDFFVNSLTPWP